MIIRESILALRHLWRRKIFSAVIITSLAVSFVCTSLLISFIISEKKADSFHIAKDNTYQVFSDDPFGGNGNIAFILRSAGIFFKDNYPEVKSVCRIANVDRLTITTSSDQFEKLLTISADSSFFKMFSFPFSGGLPANALTHSSIVLSKKTATRLFGNKNAVGQTLSINTADTSRLLTVSGIIGDAPEKSHLVFDAVIHHTALRDRVQGGATYIQLDGNHPSEFTGKLNTNAARPGLVGPGTATYSLIPLQQSYFSPYNRMAYMQTRSTLFVRICMIVCALIFFMGSFNFGNLLLLSMLERKKESGIKKTLGITFRGCLTSSFTEVFLYIAIAAPIALVVTSLLLPHLNTLLSTALTFHSLLRADVVVIHIILILILGAAIGLFTLWKNWKIKPIPLLNRSTTSTSVHSPFFYIQFVISIAIVICAATIIRQMHYVKNEPLGFNRNIVQITASSPNDDRMKALKNNILEIPGIRHATISSGNPVSGNSVVRYELEDGSFYSPFIFAGDEDFIKTLDLTLVSGELPTLSGRLVNETFVRQFNMKEPVGEKIPGTEVRISGVVKDFTCGSFKESIPPVIITIENNANRVLVDYTGMEITSILPKLQAEWNNLFTDEPWQFQVIQDDLMTKYKEETFLFKISITAAAVSITISLFGLFALCWSTLQRRVKEIGIRKVLGATPLNIFTLISWTFLKRIAIAFAIASPVGFYFSQKWLEIFAKRISVDGWIFLYAALVIFLVTVCTLVFQTVKAAFLNPADELRRE